MIALRPARPRGVTVSDTRRKAFAQTFLSSFTALECLPAGPGALLRPLLFIIGVIVLSGPWAFTQINTGDIAGTVSDPAGAIVQGASVEAVNGDTQGRFSSVTNAAGQYLLSQLPPGVYTLTANVQGFKQALAEHVSLHVNEHLRQDFSLQLGDAKESVIVLLVPGLLQTESAEIKDVVQTQQSGGAAAEGPETFCNSVCSAKE